MNIKKYKQYLKPYINTMTLFITLFCFTTTPVAIGKETKTKKLKIINTTHDTCSKTEGKQSLSVQKKDNTIVVTIKNAYLNCCLDDITVDLHYKKKRINLFIKEVNPRCKCLCQYTIKSTIKGLSKGTYKITVYEDDAGHKLSSMIFKY